jgi:urease accessory protein
MDDTQLYEDAKQTAINTYHVNRWEAKLNLVFERQNGRSFLAKNLHVGPLVLQKTLYPEGEEVCHGVVIHPPGGVAGGDALTLNVSLSDGVSCLLTTPGAGKWYKANGHDATQSLKFDVQNNACFEWLPQENILFDGAQVKFSAEINLDKEAKYAGWEILCFGRQAQGEIWQSGSMHQNLAIRRNKALIWRECGALKPQHKLIKSMMGLAGNAVSASFVVAAGVVPQQILAACRAVEVNLALDMHARYGVTALPEIFSARYVGQSAQSARQYFEQLWQILRPWYAARKVVRPRIWNT